MYFSMKFSVNVVPRHFSLKTLNPSLVNSDFEFIGIAPKWSFKMFQTFQQYLTMVHTLA